MGKTQKTASSEPRRLSLRLAKKSKPLAMEKKRPAAKKPPKVKKTKQAENGNKAEEPKAEATEAK